MKCKDCERDAQLPNVQQCRLCYQKSYGRRNKEKVKINQARWLELNPEYRRQYYRQWYQTNGRSRSLESIASAVLWQKRHPEKVRAQQILRYAVKKGTINKPYRCAKCDRETRLHGHHSDYSQPLMVTWLCASCHKNEHRKSPAI